MGNYEPVSSRKEAATCNATAASTAEAILAQLANDAADTQIRHLGCNGLGSDKPMTTMTEAEKRIVALVDTPFYWRMEV